MRAHDFTKPKCIALHSATSASFKRTGFLSRAQGTPRCEETSSYLHTAPVEVLGDLRALGAESQEDEALSQPSAQSTTSSSSFLPSTSDTSIVVSATPSVPFRLEVHNPKPPLREAGLAVACSVWRSSSRLDQDGHLTQRRPISGLAGHPQRDLANRSSWGSASAVSTKAAPSRWCRGTGQLVPREAGGRQMCRVGARGMGPSTATSPCQTPGVGPWASS